jgi:putative transposase
MLITYQYRVKPSTEQIATIEKWLELCRLVWNKTLAERFDWLRRTRCQIDRCSLIFEPIGKIPEKVDYYTQQNYLPELKKLKPEYKELYAECLQDVLRRLDKAWKRWLVPDAKGKRGGRPKFKKYGDYKSFTYPRVNCPKAGVTLERNIIKLSKIGEMKVVIHRQIPDGFILKTCTLVRKADGFYVSISAEDNTIPDILPVNKVKSSTAIDMGLISFLTTAQGVQIPVRKHFRQIEQHLARQQRILARRQKDSSNWRKQKKRVALIHQRVTRARKDFFYKTAHWLVKQFDLIGVEKLNIKGLARTRMAKSILDAAWGTFLNILQAVVVKYGKHFVKVDARKSSVECSNCGTEVPKDLSVRVHDCPNCNLSMDRDENAARVLLARSLNAVGLTVTACGGQEDTQPSKQETSNLEWVQLALF